MVLMWQDAVMQVVHAAMHALHGTLGLQLPLMLCCRLQNVLLWVS